MDTERNELEPENSELYLESREAFESYIEPERADDPDRSAAPDAPAASLTEKPNKQRIRMPLGAAIACFVVVALIVGLAFAGFKYFSGYVKQIEARVAERTVTQSPDATDDGSGAAAQSTNVPSREGLPSETLQFAANTVKETDNYAMIDSCMNTVVSIDVMVQSGYSTVTQSSGSGVLITADGYIVTCNHVVEGANKIYVYLNDGTSTEARLVGRDVINDLAVIKIEGSDYPYAALGNSADLRVGEGVFAIGNALGVLSNTYTEGVVSGLDRQIKIDGQEMTLLQTDAAINHGNSGGGLFRQSDGALIGIVNAKSAGESIEGLGFAIPSAVVGNIVSDLMDYGFVTGRAYLGVSTEDVTLSGYGFFTSYYTYPKIVTVEAGSPAEAAGLRESDIILSIDGISISGTDSLVRTLNSYKIGDTVTLTVLRDRQNVDVSVTLGERALPNE